MHKLSLAALLILSLEASTWAAPTSSCPYVLVHDPNRENIYIPQQQCGGAEQAAKIRQPECTSPDNCVSKRDAGPQQADISGQEPVVHRYMLSPPPPPAAAPEKAQPEVESYENPSSQPPLANEPIDAPPEEYENPTPTTSTSTPSRRPTPVYAPPAPTTTTTTTPSSTPSVAEPELPGLDFPPVTPTTSKKKPKAKPTPIVYKDGLTVTLKSEKDFCLFLPSSPGNKDANGGMYDRDAIGHSEKNARAFCTKQGLAPGAGPMPEGFIRSAVFKSTADYVQVDGTINNAAYHLFDEDGGGQYDDHGSGSPPQSHCKNYPYYVSLIEPDMKRFCIRCCKSYAQCNAGRSEYGCKSVLRDKS